MGLKGNSQCTILCHSQVLVTVPLRALLDQFASDFPSFCKVGTGHNKKIDFDAKAFIAVTDSVHLLKKLKFDSIFVDEAHHPLPPKMPGSSELYRFSATHKDEPDFRYTMGQAIEDGVLRDYDITVPALTAHHAYVCLGDLLLKQVGSFRRVLAYCNSIAEAKRFRMVLRELGLAAWHINGKTPLKKRQAAIAEFAGPLLKPVHVLVTVEVLGEGINIPNADTCMFVEPRNSYRSIIQAIGRVLRHHPAKTLAHIVLPAVAIPRSRSASVSPSSFGNKPIKRAEQPNAREANGLHIHKPQIQSRTPPESDCELPPATVQVEQRWQARTPQTSGIGKEEMACTPKSSAGISIAGTPATVKRRKAAGVHPAAPANGQRRDEVRSEPDCEFEAKGLEQKPRHCGNEPELQVCPTAPMDRQQDSVQKEHLHKIGGSIGRLHGHQSIQTLELQHEYLEPFKASTSDPIRPERPATVKCLSSFDQERTIVRKGDAVLSRSNQRFKLTASGESSMFDQQFSSQLERFLATLMIADHRLVGAAAGHRIQVADCTLADAGASITEGWTTEIYSWLFAVLSCEDCWEIRLKELEMFANKHGRLPLRRCWSHYERSMGRWLHTQGTAFREQRLLSYRFQKLLSASSILIRRRVGGWQTGDPDGRFRSNCEALRAYVQLHKRLPTMTRHQITSSPWKLAEWVANVRKGSITLSPSKQEMLQETHPLVKAALQKWKDAPRIHRSRWEQKLNELSMFVTAVGRLPKCRGGGAVERRCYQWLGLQCRRVLSGYLPDQGLQNAHPLIAAHIETFVQRVRANEKMLRVLEPRASSVCSRD